MLQVDAVPLPGQGGGSRPDETTSDDTSTSGDDSDDSSDSLDFRGVCVCCCAQKDQSEKGTV